METTTTEGFFAGWSAWKKLGFALGLVAIAVAVAALAWWSLRPPRAVLFSDLAERDAAVITAELDKLKLPYGLSDDGKSILVASDTVHRTRMAVMGRQLPLHGVVGFEVFNQADFGVSDFVQKVNFQRALQGELTRTILTLEPVQDARVHLALPDQTLFRKEQRQAKASVSVSLKAGHRLADEQVLGIQRLIAASVPDVKSEDVTVLDQHGVVLSRAGGEDFAVAAGQLDARRALEAHLTRKASRLLDQMFQPGESLVAIDVVLNHEQSKITMEAPLGVQAADHSEGPSGLVTRERTVSKESAAPEAGAGAAPQVVSQETDYQVGKRVSHTVSQGGQIARLTVAVVVKQSIGETELTRLRQLVSSTVGLQPGRGDVVTVHSLAEIGASRAVLSPTVEGRAEAGRGHVAAPLAVSASPSSAPPSAPSTFAITGGLLMLAILLLGLGWWRQHAVRRVSAAAPLTADDRQAVLANVRRWLEPQVR
jgi:flagellar M-ring protein FliF